ncbi:hypothetical protein [Winogradskyella forsetii]|uniref:hypothetical protein n=1 Tax=Winogradskyella forsetii TaxID=2686077 RepID=UPI0015C02098|nr:hypothetical protein [Winogradskyella forsetii]
MKKLLIAIIVIVILVFLSDKIYKVYSRSNVNSHESILLLNNQLSENEIDLFFNLEQGTYDSNEHKIVFSLLKKDGYLLDNYINLPVRIQSSTEFDCNLEYDKARPYGFYDYEIMSKNIIARIITKNASAIKQLNSKEIISEKRLGGNYGFGKLNILDINKNGLSKHCE